ncbi:MAG: AAA family ATPase [Candidatus Odinarchaeum yellowstonii]|uniref:AAA family ATPase n=1 Tax=Odinarchaeota yellowstonii (strain LCB_4) TaxID=1841599 RepID=A0AAF0IBC3_ODILC|nr:MAG: AAA family ATPase [Candidatus Odinarchaeum yellowstonii]
MKIDSIVLKNYRSYQNVELNFGDNNLIVIIGENGTGKTDILNALNWCFYSDEPHLSKRSEGKIQLNLETIKNSKNNDKADINITVLLKKSNQDLINFETKNTFEINEDRDRGLKIPKLIETEKRLIYVYKNGENAVYYNDDAEEVINHHIPRDLRQFFFFDGEKLSRYYEDVGNVRKHILKISKVSLIDEIIKKLNNIHGELMNEIKGDVDKEITNTRDTLNKIVNELNEAYAEKEDLENELKSMKLELNSLNEYLREIPDIEELEQDRDKSKQQLKEKENIHNDAIYSKNSLIVESLIYCCLREPVNEILKSIEEKRIKKEYPPLIDEELIKKALEKKLCPVCNKAIDESKLKELEEMYQIYSRQTNISNILREYEWRYKRFGEELNRKLSELNDKEKEIKRIDEDIKEINNHINEIESELKKYSDKTKTNLKQKIERRNHLESQIDLINRKIGAINKKIEDKNRAKDAFQNKLNEYLSDLKEYRNIRSQLNFIRHSVKILEKLKEKTLDKIRSRIAAETWDIFSKLTWKKATWKGIKLDEDFNIEIIHQLGYEWSGQLSAAETQLLALSFVLALHKISGFEAPIIIDTPLARVSGKHRENWAESIIKLIKEKQVILLFTPFEYNDGIVNKIIEQNHPKIFKLGINNSETITTVEEIT